MLHVVAARGVTESKTEKGLGMGVAIRLIEPTKVSKKARGQEHLGRRQKRKEGCKPLMSLAGVLL